VEDNGVGIDDAHLSRIFEMFYRANEDIEGTGIGLYIVDQSLEKINGKIKVESDLGKGSRFSIELPNLHTG
jgi:signal transduction histidine kinase